MADMFDGPFTVSLKAEEGENDIFWSENYSFCIENGFLSIYDGDSLVAVYNMDCVLCVMRETE